MVRTREEDKQAEIAKKNAEVKTYTPYYSDHDIVTVILR